MLSTTFMQGLVITILTTLLLPLGVPAQKVMENLSEDLEVRFHETANKIGLIKSGMGDEFKEEPGELSVGYCSVIPLIKVSNGPLVIGFDTRDSTQRTINLGQGLRGRTEEQIKQLRATRPEGKLSVEDEVKQKCLDFLYLIDLQQSADLEPGYHISYRGSGSRGEWYISWWRRIGGFPTEESWRLRVNDETCSVEEFENTVSSSTCEIEIRIDKNAATQKARTHAEKLRKLLCIYTGDDENDYEVQEDMKQGNGDLAIFHPNYAYYDVFRKLLPDYSYGFREDGSGNLLNEEEISQRRNKLRLVYQICFKFEYIGSPRIRTTLNPIVVWVDAGTGAVVGGL